jgi:preprotein translocase subunit YajC
MPIALMILVFYFLIMRPQQKREAKRRELVNSVKKGDHVLISSGIIGTLHKIINDKEVSLEISDGVYVRILKNSIVEVFEKGPEAGKIETDESETVRKSKVRKPMSEKSTQK